MKLKIPTLLIVAVSLTSCNSIEVAKHNPITGAVVLPFEIAGNAINTPLALLAGEKPEMVKEYDRRKAAIADNTNEKAMLVRERQVVERRIAQVEGAIRALEAETQNLLARNDTLRQQIANGNIETSEKNAELASLRDDKAALLVKVAEKEKHLAELRQDATTEDMIRRRKEQGGGDPVEAQIQRLRAIPGALSNIAT